MAESNPDPIHIIQGGRYARQDGWWINDISLCSSGNIAVSGHNYDTYQSDVSIYSSIDDNYDSRDKPTLLYHKQFTDEGLSWLTLSWWQGRYISFIKPNSTEIVTCRYHEVQVIDYNRDVVLRSRKVNGDTTCVSVSEGQIFIGLESSDIVNIYDNDLNRIKSIRLKGIRDDYPWDIAAAADRLYVCTVMYDRAIVYSQYSGNILTEYTTGQYRSEAYSIAVNIQLQIVAVLWDREQVSVYSFSDNNCLVDFNVESGVTRIRISDRGRIVTGNEDSGEIKIYNLAKFFTFQNMKITIGNLLSELDAEELVKYFKINDDIVQDSDSDSMVGSKKKSSLLTVLGKKGVLQDKTYHNLRRAFSHLGNCNTSMVMDHIDFYQKHAEKNPTQDQQTSPSKKSTHQLKLNGFSHNSWSVIDMSLGPAEHQMIISGFSKASGKTSLDWIHDKDSDAAFPWFRTREFDMKSVKQSKRFVTYIDESQIVSCCHNIVEIINLDTNESKDAVPLQVNESASCITVRNGNIYIGFEHSDQIRVLNVNLEEKMKIKLKDTEKMWPTDLAVSIGRLLVCLKSMSLCKVFLFSEVSGKKLIEYRNDVKKIGAPVSVTIHEESDLAAILWDIEGTEDEFEEKYCMGWGMRRDPEDRTYSYLSLHSLSQGFCLSVVGIGLSVRGFDNYDFSCTFECYKGCSSGKKVRISSGCVAVLDTLGGINFFDMKDIFTSDNVKSALSQMIVSNASSYKCKRKCNNSDNHNDEDNGQNRLPRTEIGGGGGGDEQHEDSDTGSSSESEEDHSEDDKSRKECSNSDNQNDDDSEQNKLSRTDIGDAGDDQDKDSDTGSSSESEEDLSPMGKHVVDIILAILRDKQHMKSDDVSVLKGNISHSIKSYYASNVKQVASKGDPVQCDRFQWDCDDYDDDDFDEDSGNCMDISFGSNNELAVALKYFRQRTDTRCVHIYHWDKNNGMQSSLNFYRKFGDGRCKLFVSCLQGFQTVTCCDDLIEITDFNAHGRIIKSYRLSSAATCMATKDGDIFVGVKSSEIVVFDSELVQKRSVTVNLKNREWPGDLTIVTGKFFVCTNGTSKRAMSLNLENGEQLTEYTYSRGQNYDMCPRNITASENLDLIGVSWFDGDDERVTVTALYSLPKGFCVSIVDNYSDGISRFSPDNDLFMVSTDGDIEYSNEDQLISFDRWKTGFAHSFPLHEYEMLIAFYNLSHTEVIDNVERKYLTDSYLINIGKMKSTLEILTRNDVISSTNIADLRKAFAWVGRLYVDRLNQPLDAYIKYASETYISKAHVSNPFGASNTIAESLLQLQYPVEGRNITKNSVCQQENLIQSNLVVPPSSLGQIFPSSLIPNGTTITESVNECARKRGHSEVDHSAAESMLHGKISKSTGQEAPRTVSAGTGIGEMGSNLTQLIPQTPSYLQLMEEDPPVSTNLHMHSSLNPMNPIKLTQAETLSTLTLPMAAPPTVSHGTSIVQVGSLSINQINQALSTPYQVRETMHSQTNLHAPPSLLPATVQPSQEAVMTQQIVREATHPNIPQVIPQQRYALSPLNQRQLLSHQLQVAQQPSNRSPIISTFNHQNRGPQGLGTHQMVTPSTHLHTPQVFQQQRHSLLPFCSQQVPTPQLQPAVQPFTEQRGTLTTPNIPMSLNHQYRQPQEQGTLRDLSQSVVHSVTSSVSEVDDPSTGPTTGNFTSSASSQTNYQSETEKNKRIEQGLNAQGDLQQMRPLEPTDSITCEVQATERVAEQTQSTSQPDTFPSIRHANRTECESIPTGERGGEESEEMTSAVESCIQKVVTPFFKDISDKLELLFGSANKRYSGQDIPGTSSQSNNNAIDSSANSSRSRNIEHDEEVVSAWESLSEYNRMSLQAFRGMTDDRAELVRRLVEMVFTEDERRTRNCFGKSGKQKLDENKLRKIRHITFYLCPIVTKKTDNDKLSLEDTEWKRLCEVIDKANRHFREKLKRQGRER